MKRISIILTVLCCLVGFTANAQVFSKGDVVLNGTIGIGSLSGYSLGLPPIALSGEFCIVDNLFDENSSIGVGALVGMGRYKTVHEDIWGKYKNTYNRLAFSARGAFHYNFVKNLDTYAGLGLGLYVNNSKYKYTYNDEYIGVELENQKASETNMGFAFSFFAGARYYFSPNFGVVAELGYGMTYLSLGVTYKL